MTDDSFAVEEIDLATRDVHLTPAERPDAGIDPDSGTDAHVTGRAVVHESTEAVARHFVIGEDSFGEVGVNAATGSDR